MGDNNVASIGKMLMQTQSGQSVTGVDGADIGTTFRKMVDQMTQIPGSSVSTGSQTAQNMQQLTPHSPEQNYDRYQYQKNKIPEQSTKDWTAGSQVSEKLESFEESVRDVIKDELQVTDEQITEAMETLGLTVADLMNPQQLAALAAELTGTEDMSALLCNEAFMNVMQSVGTLTEDLLQELGVTAEELTQLLEDAGQADMNADLMQTVQTADAGETDVKDAQKVYADTADGIRDTAEQPQMAAQAAETETRTEEAKDITPEETDAQAKTANAGAEEETAADAAAGSDKEQAQTGSNSNSGQQNFASQAHAGVDVHTGPTLTETVAMQGANSAGEYAAQVDIADVVRQIVTYTRVNYTANQETTMEMQLNPEHLGKIYLEITSKDGTVSAHLTAQNEVVKEALESRIADLKQNMNQAGVKVDAVEVTVGGHEFEKNLEQNAKQEEQQAEERESGVRQRAVLKVDEMRKYVSLKVIDLDHRDVVRDGKPLGERHAHQQRTQQSGAAREGDGVDLFGRQSGLLERRVHHGNDVLLVRPRSQFGDHAAVFDVDGLRGDDVRQQHVVAYHGGGCVVARGFDAQNSNIHAVFRFFN